ncbi:hypothetical protein NP590_09630 [Methylomonas sp. SURF-2]|uniref:Glycine zipper 2TM domain-containing protein n=1 Tax=Methylomonas subterranea TaxID=2952225 RepID=A0ABT1TFW5_9GAMM|nr:hypothetical protein [Methylomonas sp. SURF-2]MCQ8104361.1 hypothetical protein [Methylomonas sp. SURF-2]
MIRLAIIAVIGLLFSQPTLADPHWRGHGRHHHGHHHRHDHYPRYRQEYVYIPERVVEYVPVRPRYYAPPPPPATYYRYDQRSPQGLVGGMVGSAMGYQMGSGDPLAAGIGAAAGAWLGNGFY